MAQDTYGVHPHDYRRRGQGKLPGSDAQAKSQRSSGSQPGDGEGEEGLAINRGQQGSSQGYTFSQ